MFSSVDETCKTVVSMAFLTLAISCGREALGQSDAWALWAILAAFLLLAAMGRT